ncbi:hypothetical protein COB11_06305, partial [Candidatus Aerophobetes bacterium]
MKAREGKPDGAGKSAVDTVAFDGETKPDNVGTLAIGWSREIRRVAPHGTLDRGKRRGVRKAAWGQG